MCNRTGRWPVHEPVRTLENSLIFRVSRKRKMLASLATPTKKEGRRRGVLRKEGAPAFCLGGYFGPSNCLKYYSASYEQPCHSEEPVSTQLTHQFAQPNQKLGHSLMVTRESVFSNLPNGKYGLPRRFAPRNDRANSIIFYCTLDFVGQNPMLAMSEDIT